MPVARMLDVSVKTSAAHYMNHHLVLPVVHAQAREGHV